MTENALFTIPIETVGYPSAAAFLMALGLYLVSWLPMCKTADSKDATNVFMILGSLFNTISFWMVYFYDRQPEKALNDFRLLIIIGSCVMFYHFLGRLKDNVNVFITKK